MARFTRKEIRAIIGEACTDEIENQIMALYLGVVDPMKDDLAKYKADAEKLPEVQKELDDLKAGKSGGEDWKDKYEKEHTAFEQYKTSQTAKETRAAKEKAVQAYLEGKKITGDNLEIAMLAIAGVVDGLELDGDKIKDTSSLDNLVNGKLSRLAVTTNTQGANTSNPPANNSNSYADMSLGDKMKRMNEHPEEKQAILDSIK